MTDPLLRLETQGSDIVITPAGHELPSDVPKVS